MKKPWVYVLIGGLVAGTFDIVYACAFWAIKRGVSPQRILQRVASAGPSSKDSLWIAMSIAVHMVLIGIPCAVFARRAVLAELRTPVLA